MTRRSHLPLVLLLLSPSAANAAPPPPFDTFTRAWLDDPAWSNGGVERATYDATRRQGDDGGELRYEVRLTTRREVASPQTFTTSTDGQGRAVIRQHLRKQMTGEAGDVQASLTCYVGIDDYKSLKLELGLLDEQGATFKRYVNHGGTLRWEQHSPRAGEGHQTNSFAPTDNLVFFNALPAVLRGYPFDAPVEFELAVIDNQLDAGWSNTRPGKYVVRYGGRHVLDLPIGQVDAHQVMLFFIGPSREFRPPAKFWFAADAGLRHVMLRYEGPAGTVYQIRRLQQPDGADRSE